MKTRSILAVLFAYLLFQPLAQAQLSSGAILGTVADSSGAVIPGVSIRITNTGTGLLRDAVTNESGNYRVDLLQPGVYQVEADLAGFKKEVRRGVTVSIDQRARIDFTMVVGEVSEVINVEGQAPLVQTEDSNVGQVVDERKIVALPLNGREFSQLAYIVPGAYAPRPNSQLGYRGGFSVAGALEASNQFLLDGINNNANGTNEIGARVNIDAVGEFKVQTSNYSAQYGRYSGAQVDAVTKSGTNELHGSAFWFDRNSALDARNFFDPYPLDKLPYFRRHQFGAVLGGPLIKNKTFFFVGYSGERQAKLRTVSVIVPQPEFFDGNLSRIPGTIRDPQTPGQNFPGNIIPRDRISPISLGFRQFWPLPSKPGLGQNATSLLDAPDNFNQMNSKLDHQLSPRQHLSGSYTYYNEKLLEYLGGPQLSPFQTQGAVISWNISVAHVFAVSPTFINEFRTGAARLNRGRYTQDIDRAKNWNALLGIPGTQADNDPRVWGVPFVTITGYAPLGNPYPVPQPRGETNFNALDNISIQRANHALKFGVDYLKMLLNETFTTAGRGAFTFNGSRTGNAMADFLLGLPSVSQRAPAIGPPTAYGRRNSLDFFAQDDWKVTPRLTLNFGVRYEANYAMHDKYGRIATFDPATGGLRMAPNHDRYQAGIDTFLEQYPGLKITTGKFMRDDLNNVAPRFGFALTPTGRTNMVVRGGYGVFYQIQNLITMINMTAPFVLSQRFTTADNITFANPWGRRGSTISAPGFDYNERTPYYQNWNLGIQRELPGSFVIDLAYQGKKGTRLIRTRDINQPLDRTTGIRPYGFFSTVNFEESTGRSIYHALHVRSEKRAANGLSYIFSYMWGKLIDDLGTPQDSYNQRADRGLGVDDVRHRMSFSAVYQLPFGHGRKFLSSSSAVADAILGGWELSGISRANSGYHYTATISTDNSGTGNNRDKPNRIGNPDRGSAASPAAWWDRSAFAQAPRGQFGNGGKNTLTGPSFWTQDVAVAKVFKPKESQQIQLRFELFNALNHANFDDPSATWNSAAFGSVAIAFDSRQIQVGLKWIF